ncbi:Similar to pen-2: Gamma-secretase subunit pen-2 (Drosophila melanogaster) [Cotesia congregata]|uniref:Similar to pen-2: Gamma-secretase subunit pen-2 (Drosophila melanogaster) n=1 Tax=Cotesia congregata TaxID=51543 RepID=A0A8J2HIJ4_COTCN|nr:Similar to pen-2: Gamma-secretase subunit pen-2 (Drosophila melanogaster) [Cotesia congregata]
MDGMHIQNNGLHALQTLLTLRDVIFSGIGAVIWAAVLLAWVIIFQTQRAVWGEFADTISYIIPEGIP